MDGDKIAANMKVPLLVVLQWDGERHCLCLALPLPFCQRLMPLLVVQASILKRSRAATRATREEVPWWSQARRALAVAARYAIQRGWMEAGSCRMPFPEFMPDGVRVRVRGDLSAPDEVYDGVGRYPLTMEGVLEMTMCFDDYHPYAPSCSAAYCTT